MYAESFHDDQSEFMEYRDDPSPLPRFLKLGPPLTRSLSRTSGDFLFGRKSANGV